MKGYKCNNCEGFMTGDAPISLHGQFFTDRAGILLPQNDFDFCSLSCFLEWMKSVTGFRHEKLERWTERERA